MHEPRENLERRKQNLNRLTYRVLGCCMDVHRELGPGLLESAYEEALAYEFTHSRLAFARQCVMPLCYKNATIDCGYRLDFYIEAELILELKAVSELAPVHHAQILTYLKLAHRSLGLLINFNVPVLKDGIRRVVNGDLFKDEK